ncbi:MAG TPA: GNAT family N-acetyltransferase [Anaerolineaceae bacterium]|nr:GNAT family N-acetyltransferase [Anaerolineaceae bacterium]
MNSPDFSIVEATWRDLPDLRRLEQQAFGRDAWPLIDLIGVVTLPGVVRLKAVESNDQMLGFIAGDIDSKNQIGWVTTIAVFPEQRRRGVASALLAAGESRMGTPRVRLSVRRSNREAIHLYENRDYHLVDVWNHYYADGEDALVMEKKAYEILS